MKTTKDSRFRGKDKTAIVLLMSIDNLENKRKKLIFRSWHRGTKEMDLLMGSFADEYVPGFSEEELALYEEILKENDPDLYNWISGREDAPVRMGSSVFEALCGWRYKNHE